MYVNLSTVILSKDTLSTIQKMYNASEVEGDVENNNFTLKTINGVIKSGTMFLEMNGFIMPISDKLACSIREHVVADWLTDSEYRKVYILEGRDDEVLIDILQTYYPQFLSSGNVGDYYCFSEYNIDVLFRLIKDTGAHISYSSDNKYVLTDKSGAEYKLMIGDYIKVTRGGTVQVTRDKDILKSYEFKIRYIKDGDGDIAFVNKTGTMTSKIKNSTIYSTLYDIALDKGHVDSEFVTVKIEGICNDSISSRYRITSMSDNFTIRNGALYVDNSYVKEGSLIVPVLGCRLSVFLKESLDMLDEKYNLLHDKNEG